MNKIILKQMGMNDRIIRQQANTAGHAGRVVSQYKGLYRVMTSAGLMWPRSPASSGMKREGPAGLFPQWAFCHAGPEATRAAMPSSTMCSREKRLYPQGGRHSKAG